MPGKWSQIGILLDIRALVDLPSPHQHRSRSRGMGARHQLCPAPWGRLSAGLRNPAGTDGPAVPSSRAAQAVSMHHTRGTWGREGPSEWLWQLV